MSVLVDDIDSQVKLTFLSEECCREVKQCAIPPFRPLPPLLAESPQMQINNETKQAGTRQIKSIIIAQEQPSSILLTEPTANNAAKSSSPSLATKSKKKVRKKHT